MCLRRPASGRQRLGSHKVPSQPRPGEGENMTAHRDRPARPGSDRDLGRGEHRMRKRLLIVFVVTLPLVIAMIAALAASAAPPAATTVTPGWVTDLAGGSGSTV